MGCVPRGVKNVIIKKSVVQDFLDTEKKIKLNRGLFIQELTADPSEKYEILCTLGEGSYGKVFKVQDKDNKLLRAMKVIKKKYNYNPEEEAKMIKEINILKALIILIY